MIFSAVDVFFRTNMRIAETLIVFSVLCEKLFNLLGYLFHRKASNILLNLRLIFCPKQGFNLLN